MNIPFLMFPFMKSISQKKFEEISNANLDELPLVQLRQYNIELEREHIIAIRNRRFTLKSVIFFYSLAVISLCMSEAIDAKMVTVMSMWFLTDNIMSGILKTGSAIFAAYSILIALMPAIIKRPSITSIEYHKKLVDDAIFIKEIQDLPIEEKSLRQLSHQQASVGKYNSLYLSQMRWVFILGVVVIVFGAAMVSGTVVVSVFMPETDVTALVSGFVGGVLINFIGAIFISMYTKTMESATSFQKNMISTVNAYLSNALAAQIKDEGLRNQTISEIAKELVRGE